MPFELQSPFGDDETRTKDVSMLLEEFIEEKWNQAKTGVSVGDVAFGVFGDQILQVNKPITLRAYQINKSPRRQTVGGGRWSAVSTQIVDIYVLNNETNNSRDPSAIAIDRWLEELFIVNQGVSYKGIYDMNYRGGNIDSDPFATNITRLKVTVELSYIMDVVET